MSSSIAEHENAVIDEIVRLGCPRLEIESYLKEQQIWNQNKNNKIDAITFHAKHQKVPFY